MAKHIIASIFGSSNYLFINNNNNNNNNGSASFSLCRKTHRAAASAPAAAATTKCTVTLGAAGTVTAARPVCTVAPPWGLARRAKTTSGRPYKRTIIILWTQTCSIRAKRRGLRLRRHSQHHASPNLQAVNYM